MHVYYYYYYYLLQLGCYPVAGVILHLYKMYVCVCFMNVAADHIIQPGGVPVGDPWST